MIEGNIVVTGGAGALGREVCAFLDARGYQSIPIDLAPLDLGERLAFGGVNLTKESELQPVFSEIAEKAGGINGLVNIAGGFVWELVEGGDLAHWDRMFEMNLRTTATCCSVVLPYLKKSLGAIVNVGAAAAASPGAGMAPYAASKAGVRALTESLAEELRNSGVRVNAILPTIIDTPANRRDMPGTDPTEWVTAESIARVIAFLLSQEAGAITGASIPLSLNN